MINKINSANVFFSPKANNQPNATSPIKKDSNVVQFKGQLSSGAKLASAYQALYGIQTAKSVNFKGHSLSEAFRELKHQIKTCGDTNIGDNVDISNLIYRFSPDLPQQGDAMKTNILLSESKDKEGRPTINEARTQIKNAGKNGYMYEMAVRRPRLAGTEADTSLPLKQDIKFYLADRYRDDKGRFKPSPENAYILIDKKGIPIGVTEDKELNYMLLANAGKLKVKNSGKNIFSMITEKEGVDYKPFIAPAQEVRERHPQESVGNGAKIVIAMENGRFVPEIMKSIEDFEKKVKRGEIVLDTFHAAPNADKTKIIMLAGGLASRSEFANASSPAIFNGDKNGAMMTKGIYQTATGLTPMETSFVTLHNMGLLDLSKFAIGENVEFYVNKGSNYGNGGFSVDCYNAIKDDNTENVLFIPNDPVSRLTKALEKSKKIADSGEAALVMVAKEVDPSEAKDFGIMKLDDDGQILGFAEKPKNVDKSFILPNGQCSANTFQFFASKEAFEALDVLDSYFPDIAISEARDWSGVYTPALMAFTLNDDPKDIQKQFSEAMDKFCDSKNAPHYDSELPIEVIKEVKSILGNQKVIGVPTNEPWADCGSLNALAHTTMQIASGDFPMEDFERAHVLDSVNTQTGLITSSPEMKEAIEDKYDIEGQVMVAPVAQKVDPSIEDKYVKYTTVRQ